MSATIRSKSLQVRRHEKNFLIYGDLKDINSVHLYLKDLIGIINEVRPYERTGSLQEFEKAINEYSMRFNSIEAIFWRFQNEFARLDRLNNKQYSIFAPLIKTTFLERPLINAELLKKALHLKPEHRLIKMLQDLDSEINALRKNGEEMISISKDIDESAREKVERALGLSQKSALMMFPLFFLVGMGVLFIITHRVVKRLNLLKNAIKETGKGDFIPLFVTPDENDEVGKLIRAFNEMELELFSREKELLRKNEEILQSRRLASIGTLASGIAHELNNPLNNIYLAAQILTCKRHTENL